MVDAIPQIIVAFPQSSVKQPGDEDSQSQTSPFKIQRIRIEPLPGTISHGEASEAHTAFLSRKHN